MYSPIVTAQRILEGSRKLGLTLKPHSTEEIAEQIKRLNEIVADDGSLKRPLSGEEEEWVVNERSLCKLDFRYWSSSYAYIMHYSENRLVKFNPNIAQNIVLEVWGQIEEQGREIAMQQGKARQLGVSTETELAVTHRVQFYRHVNALVASSDPDKSFKMSQMMERCWENQPWWLMPRQTKYVAGNLIEFGELDSGVSIQHGSQMTGIGRGDTPTVVHLSELCEFNNPEQLVDASLLRAMHESPWMFLVLESTALGRKNWWHKVWEYSKQYYQSGMARFYPMFLPWFVGSDIYPTKTWLHSHPIPKEWEPAQLTLHHAERAKNYVKTDPTLKKFIGETWEMPLEQMWWWEVNRQEYAAKKELAQFYSETPADDLEMFQSTNVSAFDTDTLTTYRENTRHPLAVFGFIGRADQIPYRMQPDKRDMDPNLPPINIRSRWNTSQEPFECQLAPLKFYPTSDPHGKLLLWEFPEENELYGLGVDTGDGIGLDRSVLEVLRKGTLERADAIVAEYCSPYINAFDLWAICMAVGTLYSPRFEGTRRQAKIVVDCLKNGEATQWELRKRGWSNFHVWQRYDNKKIRQGQSNKLGWFANSWARSMMMDYAIKALRDDQVDIFSKHFVDEMADLERDEFKQSLKAVFGGHDDRFVAFGMVFISLHINEVRGALHSLAAQRTALRETNSIDPIYHVGYQGTEDISEVSTMEETQRRLLLYEDDSVF